MFKIYDLNMKEIPFPDGVMPLEIFVGSISKERMSETADGRTGIINYGFNYTDRPVELLVRLKSHDHIDYRLLRNEMYNLFDTGEAFYVAESHLPSRVLKVVVDDSYIPDRLTEHYADVDINCRTLDSVFWESTYTTLELHDSGYSAIAEKYGLVDNIDDEKVRYTFYVRDFTVWNAGNVRIRPEFMALEITIKNLITDGNFKLENKTTGEVFGYVRPLNGEDITIEGVSVDRDGINVFRHTNHRFISLAPGDNQISVSGGYFNEISFDFKYLYK